MTLAQCRAQWENSGEVLAVVTDKRYLGRNRNQKEVFSYTIYVILYFGENSGHSLHKYFKIGENWTCSIETDQSTLGKCLSYLDDAFHNSYPRDE